MMGITRDKPLKNQNLNKTYGDRIIITTTLSLHRPSEFLFCALVINHLNKVKILIS